MISSAKQLNMSHATTFSYEEQLKDLKVPSLDTTLEKYLYSVRTVASDQEFKKTSDICDHFAKNEGLQLQKKLKEREKNHRNWVEELWLNKGYLESRAPLQYLCMSGSPSFHETFWPFKSGTQVTRASFGLFILVKFWKIIRSEQLQPHKNNKGEPLSMFQLRTLFNTCRVPRQQTDKIANYFKTDQEGEVPAHIVVLRKGHLFKVPLFDSVTGKPFTPPQYENALKEIMENCERMGRSSGVAALTSLDRDTWAHIRGHMIEMSQSNRRIMIDIESSVLVLSLDDSKPKNLQELLYDAIAGDPIQRWRDKSLNIIWTSNGGYEASADHTTLDGMMLVLLNEFTSALLQTCNGVWEERPGSASDAVCKFEPLVFDLDDVVVKAIDQGKQMSFGFSTKFGLICPVFDRIGKVEMKDCKVHSDAFVQICLQLAYMRMHGVPAPTYETATTRQFYHGRTETCRTCTPELVKFCRALIDGKPRTEVQNHLKSAHDRLVWLMKECQNNRGCDRHLFGLALAAKEMKMPAPELFTDPMYNKTGGNSNFVLSTSFAGFFNTSGATVPMVDNGYGVFYRINNHRIVMTITTWNYSTVTNPKKYENYVHNAIKDVHELFQRMNKSLL